MKIKIAYDIDDLLLDFMNPFVTFWNYKNGTSFKKRDIFSYRLEESFRVSKEEKDKTMIEFYKSKLFRNLLPLQGAREGLSFLNREVENIILTSRLLDLGIDMREITESCLERNFEGNYSSVFYSKNHETKGQSKADICGNLGVSLLMDDCLSYALECNQKGIPVFLIDSPWNQGNLEGTLITRVKDWKEILEEIGKRELVGN